jgi:ABC-type phosphate/phosphonate transport system substrate-binding protein
MNHMPTKLLAGAAVVALAAAGCSSSASKSTGGPGASTGPSAAAGTTAGGALKTVKIGLLSDQTGAAASGTSPHWMA